MKLETEVISKEVIKPSSPTPDHLRHYHLSFLDQISPPVYNPLLLFYPAADGDVKINSTEKTNQLKQSLSEVLSLYYPLAGRIQDNLFVECNDEGIPFFQAEVRCRLSQVSENPAPGELSKLIPFALDDAEGLPLGIQYNIFECGGIVIGLCISHKIGDALSLLTFIKSWAATSRGEEDHIMRPEFISATLFPPINISGFKPATGITKEDVVTKRFVFSSSSIELLKEKYSAGGSLENQRPPSRVEALSVFIWRRFMAATKAESRPERIYSMVHAVNLRSRMEPPLPEYSFGNYYRIAFTIPSAGTGEENYSLVRQVRDSIGKLDRQYVEKLQKGSEHLDFIKEQAAGFLNEDEELLQHTVATRC
ncbi:ANTHRANILATE N-BENZOYLTRANSFERASE [Salix purpurea]|uniref:ANTHRANILATE N-BENZOYLTRANSFERASE n=1 Tax=Salix purpurea TaxID=77065 RepID=A0A9Q0Z352_SALPP|nr:ANTHRANILATE N-BENZOYLTRANSFERASE [Salix purpurea]